ncbi:MAG: hypothetical protein VXX30_05545, partial [Planctomycetota bacterium]|nr:hypothetical protein [Planctomycetota bacterium]
SRGGAAAGAVLLFIGFCSVPLAMLTNAIGPPPDDVEAAEAMHPTGQESVVVAEGEAGWSN